MAVKVIVPNKNYKDSIAGVWFQNGVGVFEDEALGRQIAAEMGYEVEEMKAVKVEDTKPTTTPKKEVIKK